MRITNQMLNESARKAGLPVNNVSLLNYINSSSLNNTLSGTLNKSSSAVDTAKKASYEKLEKSADALLQQAEIFTAEGEKSIFEKARESGSTQEIQEGVQELVENYNAAIKALKSASAPLNDYYRQMLQEAADENSELLESIGITVAKDKTLSIDADKLKAADVDTLKQALTGGTFGKKTAFLASRISSNAQANIKSLSSQYNAAGNIYSAQANKFDFLG